MSVETSDLAMIGVHELRVKASLAQHPGTETAQVILPIEFIKCNVQVSPWKVANVFVPSTEDVTVIVIEPVFRYTGQVDCAYFWSAFAVTRVTRFDQSESVVLDPESYLTFDSESLTFKFLSQQTYDGDEVLSVQLEANFSD